MNDPPETTTSRHCDSMVGLTRDTYAFSLIDLLEMFMFLLRKLMVLLALEQIVLICLPHLRSMGIKMAHEIPSREM
jgi:hypothetical protein